MVEFINSLWNSLYVRNVAILISGTAISQALVLLSSPILSRIYDPTAFGILAVVLAVGEPFIEVASLKYDVAVVQARDEHDAQVFWLICSSSLDQEGNLPEKASRRWARFQQDISMTNRGYCCTG